MRWRLTNNDSRGKLLRGAYGEIMLAPGEARDVVGDFDPARLAAIGVTAVEAPARRTLAAPAGTVEQAEAPEKAPRRRTRKADD